MKEQDNIIPIRKSDRFYLCKGCVNSEGEVHERERVGVAFLKPSSSMFRLRLWMFPKGEYFLAREDGDHFHYTALCRDEFDAVGVGLRSQWHKIGTGEVLGNFIRIRFHLLSDDVYLCLFPDAVKKEEAIDAA